ncbi:MAG: hypothetical protein AAF423_14195 [Pseudomonadota bacterium]
MTTGKTIDIAMTDNVPAVLASDLAIMLGGHPDTLEVQIRAATSVVSDWDMVLKDTERGMLITPLALICIANCLPVSLLNEAKLEEVDRILDRMNTILDECNPEYALKIDRVMSLLINGMQSKG